MWSEPTKRAIIASAGLSLSLAFFMPPFPLSRFTPMQVLYPLWYEALFLFLLIVTVLAIALRKPCERLILHHPGAASVAFACAALGSLALLVLPVPVGTGTVTFIILLLAVGSAGSFLIWTYTISSFDERTALVVLIAGQAVSSLLCLFLALLAISTTATLVAGILVPTLSGTLWLLARSKAAEPVEGTDTGTVPRGNLFLVGLFLLFIWGGRIIIGLFLSTGTGLSKLELVVREMVIIGIAIYLALRIIKVDKPLVMATALGWLPVCAIFFCGLIITIAPGIHSFPVGKGLANGAISCIELFAYILAFRLVSEKRLSPMQSFGFTILFAKIIPLAIQRLIVPRFASVVNVNDDIIAFSVVVVVMLAITALLYWFFRMATSGMNAHAVASRDSSPLSEHTEAQADTLDAHVGACAAVAARGNLTSRETEILSLLAQGHTQKKVAEALFISISTVQWYARGIYRKLGVHSRQELIDMVDAEMERANRE